MYIIKQLLHKILIVHVYNTLP